ncbi:hypothetical protein VTI74DRAFT_2503 [Chaetomium olivicolor]
MFVHFFLQSPVASAEDIPNPREFPFKSHKPPLSAAKPCECMAVLLVARRFCFQTKTFFDNLQTLDCRPRPRGCGPRRHSYLSLTFRPPWCARIERVIRATSSRWGAYCENRQGTAVPIWSTLQRPFRVAGCCRTTDTLHGPRILAQARLRYRPR